MEWFHNIKFIKDFIERFYNIISPSFKLNSEDRKIYTELQEQIINCCDIILRSQSEYLLDTAEKELDKLQKIKISVNTNIINENIVNLLNEIIHEVANLISSETIINNSINHSQEERDAINERLNCLSTISKLRKEIEIVFRIATIKKGLIIWKK